MRPASPPGDVITAWRGCPSGDSETISPNSVASAVALASDATSAAQARNVFRATGLAVESGFVVMGITMSTLQLCIA